MTEGLNFLPDIAAFVGQRSKSSLTVLCGGNNSGKSAVLKSVQQQIGRASYLVGPARFYHVPMISTMQPDPNELDNIANQFQNSFTQPDINHEQNILDFSRILTNLSNNDRNKLFEVCGKLIGSKFSLQKMDPANDLSMSYIDMDGQNLSLGSTGTRLLMTLLGICFDSRFNTILIDEPELGLSPKVQEAFASFLQDEELRTELFPHLSNIYLATHSHLFLDRNEPRNNFVISRKNTDVAIDQIEAVSELHRLQFNLLGNSLEKISLPSAILVVEGPSDHSYLKRLIELKFPSKRITVASSEGNPKGKVHLIKDMLGGDLQKSPYRDRLFVVVDSIHAPGLSASLESMGVNKKHIVVWDKNGIEFVYPPDVLSSIFSVPENNVLDEISISGDQISVRTLSYTKVKLCEEVISKMDSMSKIPDELNKKLIIPLQSAIS